MGSQLCFGRIREPSSVVIEKLVPNFLSRYMKHKLVAFFVSDGGL